MIEEILKNLYKVPVPIPNNPLKELNCYVLKGKARNLIIDTGMNRTECLEALQPALEDLEVDLNETDFFITHLHADHSGLVSEFKTPTSKVYCSYADSKIINYGRASQHWNGMRDFLGSNGFPTEELEVAIKNHPGYKYCATVPIDFTIIGQGHTLEIGDYVLQCIETPGHTKGHLCLYEPEKRLFFSGDHLLNDITPNISMISAGENPLQDYLESLDKIDILHIDLVLPAHRRLFSDHKKRIRELKDHHQARATEVLDILEQGPLNGYQIASQMTWDLTYKAWEDFPVQQRWFAAAEGLAHARYLEGKGLIGKDLKNGIYLYHK